MTNLCLASNLGLCLKAGLTLWMLKRLPETKDALSVKLSLKARVNLLSKFLSSGVPVSLDSYHSGGTGS